MSNRELIALGTSSQVPTRERNHNAYLLRWDGEGFLFDPGEGTQRQLILANISASCIRHICITHFHGDHCLGLAGVLQRLSVDRCEHPVNLYYPESGQVYVERLQDAAIYKSPINVRLHPVAAPSGEMTTILAAVGYTLKSFPLEHSVPTIGYRLEEPPSLRFLPEKLSNLGIHGPMVGELQREGSLNLSGKSVTIEEVTVPRAGSIFAFVMDTRICAGAVALAQDADLVVMEATYTSEHLALAGSYLHLTAADAARAAKAAGARKLALGHFSQRYIDVGQHLREAQEFFPDVITLNDLDKVEVPRRA